MSVRGIGRRSARPPYTTLCATLLAADATWSGFGIRSMGGKYQLIGWLGTSSKARSDAWT